MSGPLTDTQQRTLLELARTQVEMLIRSGEQLRPWSEALFRWARLCEVNLDRIDKSIELYEQLVERAPSTELGRLASTKLVRLRTKTGARASARASRASATAPSRKKAARQRSKKGTAQKSKK